MMNFNSRNAQKKDKQAVENKGATLIAANAELVGDLTFADQLIVNGTVKGNVRTAQGGQGTLTVSDQGAIEGQVRVPTVIINGRVVGDVYADKHLELDAKARIEGNLFYRVIEVVKGARVQGRMIFVESGEMPVGAGAESAGQPHPHPDPASDAAEIKALPAGKAAK